MTRRRPRSRTPMWVKVQARAAAQRVADREKAAELERAGQGDSEPPESAPSEPQVPAPPPAPSPAAPPRTDGDALTDDEIRELSDEELRRHPRARPTLDRTRDPDRTSYDRPPPGWDGEGSIRDRRF